MEIQPSRASLPYGLPSHSLVFPDSVNLHPSRRKIGSKVEISDEVDSQAFLIPTRLCQKAGWFRLSLPPV